MSTRQLSATDEARLDLDRPRTPAHIGWLQVYRPIDSDSRPTYADILDDLGERLHLAPRFRKKVVAVRLGLDFPYWADDPDSIWSNTSGTCRCLVEAIGLDTGHTSRGCTQRTPRRRRPLWKTTVIDGLDDVEAVSPGSVAQISRSITP